MTRSLRRMYFGVVNTQGLQNTLPRTCTSHLDATSCFFPQNIINQVKSPLFILNSAFDSWQIESSIAPPSADPSGSWHNCSSSFKKDTWFPGNSQPGEDKLLEIGISKEQKSKVHRLIVTRNVVNE
ncbi:hypothetical protein HID58_052276, partial [Brassica napus]